MSEVLLAANNVAMDYNLPRTSLLGPRARVHVLQNISFTIHAGESLGLVGASGSGKSTLARLVTGLEAPTSGTIDRSGLEGEGVQMVFQDPFSSLDPRQKIWRIVTEPLFKQKLAKSDLKTEATGALHEVGLGRDALEKYPHEFSGGQRQRIAIARALIKRPSLLIADEPVSALDVSVQAQILNLFSDLRSRLNLAYLFISHDLSVVAHITDKVMVIADGEIIEQGRTADVLNNPTHDYTKTLIDAALPPDPVAARAKLGRA